MNQNRFSRTAMPAFMFTDIENSTLALEKYKDLFLKALKRHDAILKGNIVKYGGRIISHTGDGIFSVFEDGGKPDPMGCALEIQKQLWREDWGEIGEIRIRMGLHAGPAEKRGDGNEENYFGPVVVRTARLMAVGWGGQILVTPEVAKTYPLPAGASLQDMGVHQLKDLGEPQQIYGLLHPDLKLREFPPLRSLSAHPNNLPHQLTPFLGREEELREIEKLLSDPGCRLLTLLGPGGIGKTRLALQAGAEAIEKYPDGVFFIPFSPFNPTDSVIPIIAKTLKLSLGGTEQKAQFLNYFKDKTILLILDNFEHLVPGGEILLEILQAGAGVDLLVTSRQRLNLRAEWVFEVQGMKDWADDSGQKFEENGAVQIFIQSARRAQVGFKLSEKDRPAVARLCRLVEGTPLALELAASWVRKLSCSEIADEIEKNRDFLAGTMGDLPERQRSMRAVFEYSWKFLSDTEKKVLSVLSVFRGGFRREAAEKVAGALLPVLSTLADKSLLQRTAKGRYAVHGLTRRYAEEKLEESPLLKKKAKFLHGAFYFEFLSRKLEDFQEELFSSKQQRKLLEDLWEDIENIRADWTGMEDGKVSGFIPPGELDLKGYCPGPNEQKITTRDLAIFARHLMVLLKGGLSPWDAMGAIAGKTENKFLAEIILKARADLKEGKKLQETLRDYPQIFRSKFLNIISVGSEDNVLQLMVELLGLHLRNVEALEGRPLQGLDEEAKMIYRDVFKKFDG